MILWRQHSYTAALEMERTRLGAIAVATAMTGKHWRTAVGPLLRLQINLGEADASAVATALALAAERPLTGHSHGQNTTDNPASERPESGHDDSQGTATLAVESWPSKRSSRGHDTAEKVTKLAAKHPDWSAAQLATSLGIGERTARRHGTGRYPCMHFAIRPRPAYPSGARPVRFLP